ncbi:MAG: hypothetical protein JNL62_14445 [Bryobacterales bacterium]|nr:hypothetical protein [Bryobacterales bacterium]
MATTTQRFGHFSVIAATLWLAGCGIDLQVYKKTVDEGESATVRARLSTPVPAKVKFQVTSGEECVDKSEETVDANEQGLAKWTFKGAEGVEDCLVTLWATAELPASKGEAGGKPRALTGSTSFYVNKLPLTKSKIDGVSILVLFLIASFAIDRSVRGAMFALSYFSFWRRWVPDSESPASAGPHKEGVLWTPDTGGRTDVAAPAKNQRLAYTILAGALSILVLGWFGNVRMLAAIGFAQVHPAIDALFTGLLLVGGADRTEALLKAMGAGQGGEPGRDLARPVEIRGSMVLEDSRIRSDPSPAQ